MRRLIHKTTIVPIRYINSFAKYDYHCKTIQVRPDFRLKNNKSCPDEAWRPKGTIINSLFVLEQSGRLHLPCNYQYIHMAVNTTWQTQNFSRLHQTMVLSCAVFEGEPWLCWSCIVLYWWGSNCCPIHCDLFKIYCAPPNLGITRTWICREYGTWINFAQRPIFSGLRFFNEPEVSDSGPDFLVLYCPLRWMHL